MVTRTRPCLHFISCVALVAFRPKQFSYRELKIATNGFHSSRIIGHGAFESVYKAYTAAVKRSKHSHEGKTDQTKGNTTTQQKTMRINALKTPAK
ncbi:hypothetical protein L1887_18405 [Cichorium endivia]|nr:hypothetical protein L1887_18405 [Cichorium endivia]